MIGCARRRVVAALPRNVARRWGRDTSAVGAGGSAPPRGRSVLGRFSSSAARRVAPTARRASHGRRAIVTQSGLETSGGGGRRPGDHGGEEAAGGDAQQRRYHKEGAGREAGAHTDHDPALAWRTEEKWLGVSPLPGHPGADSDTGGAAAPWLSGVDLDEPFGAEHGRGGEDGAAAAGAGWSGSNAAEGSHEQPLPLEFAAGVQQRTGAGTGGAATAVADVEAAREAEMEAATAEGGLEFDTGLGLGTSVTVFEDDYALSDEEHGGAWDVDDMFAGVAASGGTSQWDMAHQEAASATSSLTGAAGVGAGAWPFGGGSPDRRLTPQEEQLMLMREHAKRQRQREADRQSKRNGKKSLLQRQLELETLSMEQTVDRYRKVCNDVIRVGKAATLGPGQAMMTRWFKPLATAIDDHQRWLWSVGSKKNEATGRGSPRFPSLPRYGPYMLALPPETLAVVAIHETINMLLPGGGLGTTANVTSAIGRSCNAEVNMMKLKRADRRQWQRLTESTPSTTKVLVATRRVLEDAAWSQHDQVALGASLLDLLLRVATVRLPPEAVAKWHSPADPSTTAVAGVAAQEELGASILAQPVPTDERKEDSIPRTRGQSVAEAAAAAAAAAAERAVAGAEMMASPLSQPEGLGAEAEAEAEAGAGSAAVASDEATAADNEGGDELAGVSVSVPAFRHVIKFRAGKRHGYIQCHDVIPRLFDHAQENTHSTFYPMLVPPRPWTTIDQGGYLKQQPSLVRTHSRLHMQALRHADMPLVYEGLNGLSKVPWAMNQFVHEWVGKAWESGGGIGDLPSRTDLEMPVWVEPTREEVLEAAGGLLEPDDDEGYERMAKKMKRRFKLEYGRALQNNRDLHSLRCDFQLKKGVADMLLEDRFYFPFNMDFRGRAYPVPPHLNHLGSDVCRGLLLFDERRPVGERGLRWLKIHLSNLMGVDKVSMDEREQFVNEHLEEVHDSVRNPLDGKNWWLNADYPWQALATCKELVNALSLDDPTSYLSNLPVHQDGSCNGLQHYAALGRDAEGGAAVNLTPFDRPQDVYSVVLEKVLEQIEIDSGLGAGASKDPPSGLTTKQLEAWESDREAAAFVRGKVTRKVCKQSIMTSVYGVTLVGARAQIAARLKEVFEDAPIPVEEKDRLIFSSSLYLARVTLASLADMFQGADAIKEWFGETARTAARHGQPMSWVTPLGMPVMQPYRQASASSVRTMLQSILISTDSDKLPVMVQKQRTAFAPNFVHSLDATHMLMTALDCTRSGITYTAVHDSYWTHPGDVDKMNVSLREQFIRLYSLPLLEDLRTDLQLRFPGVTFPELPPRGTLDLNLVRESEYFFS